MIEYLAMGHSAYFYRISRALSSAAIGRLFTDLRNMARKRSTNLFCVIREDVDGALFSAIGFSFERPVGFLDAGRAFDRVHGCLILVERGEYVAIFKTALELPTGFKSRYLKRVDRSQVEAATATANAVFERVRVKSTSPSKQILRTKTLEAADLAVSMPMGSASRYFPQGYSVARDDGHFSATPSTGRISQRGDRSDRDALVAWASAVIGQLSGEGAEISPFIRHFARHLDLENLPAGVEPIVLAVDVPQLTELLLADHPQLRLVRVGEADDAMVELANDVVAPILAALDESFSVRRGRPDFRIWRGRRAIGRLKQNKGRFAIRALDLPELRGVFVERRGVAVGDDAERQLLARYIDREDLFTILFSEPALAYVEGELFRDEAMFDGGANFLKHLRPAATLANATSEKGDPAATDTQFAPQSVFGIIINSIAPDDILLCDDLGNEWADFVGIHSASTPPTINFYHGKHGALTLGASSFHISVSQAEKNLGNLALPADAMELKYAGWAGHYTSGQGTQTQIPKLVRGGTIDTVRQRIDEIREAPDVVQHVHIVTSSLSKAAVAAAFADIAGGGRPSAHFVQLYWLLTSYFSACKEMGAVGFVICQD